MKNSILITGPFFGDHYIWHSMRSPEEREQNSISAEDAMQRGMEFGWSKIFESATYGSLGMLAENTGGMEAFGQGVHALQDAFAHRGVDYEQGHSITKDQWPSLVDGGSADYEKSAKITASAILVQKLMSNNFGDITNSSNTIYVDGMSDDQKKQLYSKIKEFLASGHGGSFKALKVN